MDNWKMVLIGNCNNSKLSSVTATEAGFM